MQKPVISVDPLPGGDRDRHLFCSFFFFESLTPSLRYLPLGERAVLRFVAEERPGRPAFVTLVVVRPETMLRFSPNRPAWLLLFFDGRLHHKQKVPVRQKHKKEIKEKLKGSVFTWRGLEATGNPVSPLHLGRTELPVARDEQAVIPGIPVRVPPAQRQSTAGSPSPGGSRYCRPLRTYTGHIHPRCH